MKQVVKLSDCLSDLLTVYCKATNHQRGLQNILFDERQQNHEVKDSSVMNVCPLTLLIKQMMDQRIISAVYVVKCYYKVNS